MQVTNHSSVLVPIIYLLIVFGSLSGGYAVRASDMDVKTRIVTEYPRALRRIEEYYRRSRGVAKQEEKSYYIDKAYAKGSEPINKVGVDGLPYPMAVTRVSHLEFAYSDSRVLLRTRRLFSAVLERNPDGSKKVVEVKDPKEIPPERVYCAGDSGSFAIAFGPDSETPVVSSVGGPGDVAWFLNQAIDNSWLAPVRVAHRQILDWVSSSGLVIEKVGEIEEAGRKLIWFEFTVKSEDKKLFPFTRARLTLSPQENWVARKIELSGKRFPKELEINIDYYDPLEPGGVPYPRSVCEKGPYSVVTTSFEKLVHEDVPASQFTLSAFGLPDINKPINEHVPGQAARWYYWAAGVALVVAVGLKVYLGYVSKRQAKPV